MKAEYSVARYAALLLAFLLPAAAQQTADTGSIEVFVAASPTGGRPQPAPQLPVYLLRKSFADLRVDADKETPPPNLDAFIDELELSAELKAWMKKKKSVRLTGQDFTRQLTTDEVMNIPEFWEAYLARNAHDVTVGFPKAKFKENNPDTNPQRYEQERKEYRERIKKYLTSYQHTKDGIDLHMTAIDPSARWARKEADRLVEVKQRILQLAQSRYLVANGETDLQGRGGFVRVPPGDYWLSTLEHEAVAGDVRLRWDLPVQVRAGAVTRVELTNVNALPRTRR